MVILKGYFVKENVGLLDRSLRLIAGAAMLAVPYLLMIQENSSIHVWYSLSMLLSVYPILTGIIGFDPLYKLYDAKTCDLSQRNQCGDFPYQVDALFQHHSTNDDEFDDRQGSGHQSKAA